MIILLPFAIACFLGGCGGEENKQTNPIPAQSSGDVGVKKLIKRPQTPPVSGDSRNLGPGPANDPAVLGSQTGSQKPSGDPNKGVIPVVRTKPVVTPADPSGSNVLPSSTGPLTPPTPRPPRPLYPPRPPMRTPRPIVNGADIQRAADDIGEAYRNRQGWNLWQQYTYDIASILTRPDIEFIEEAEPIDFWNRAQGPALLLEANGDFGGCQDDGYDNPCHALMMLVGNMPLPNDTVEMADFFRDNGITDFIQGHAVQLSNKLLNSARNSLNNQRHFPYDFSPTAQGMVRGYAVNWAKRFPQILTAEPIHPDLSRILILHGLKRLTVVDIANEPNLEPPELEDIDRNDPLASLANIMEFLPIRSFRLGINRVRYLGEVTYGVGLLHEWFALMETAINGTNTVFNTRPDATVEQLHPRRDIPENQLKAVGLYFALCIIHNRPTRLNLSEGFFKLLAGRDVGVDDITEIDEDLANTLRNYRPGMTPEEFARNDPRTSLDGSDENLTLANMERQVAQRVRNIIMNENPDAFRAISQGLYEIIPQNFLNGIGSLPFKRLICAIRHIDPAQLIAHIDFTLNWLPDRQDWIRRIIMDYDQNHLSNLLRFVTGIQVLPAGGFAAIRRMTFRAYNVADKPFPTSHTCHSYLDVPQYDTLEQMRTILTNVIDTAIFSGMSEEADPAAQHALGH